jgi:NAD(P)-dependent dehydrogenase (short-subunit alcohol dehydrogenase family)
LAILIEIPVTAKARTGNVFRSVIGLINPRVNIFLGTNRSFSGGVYTIAGYDAKEDVTMKGRPSAIVTGGGQGIGKAIAKRLAEKGLNVTIADTDQEAGRETAEEYARLGSIRFIPCDVSEDEQVRHLIEETASHTQRLDAVVNNAGIFHFKPLQDITPENWNDVIGVNLTGTFLCCKYAAPHLSATQGTIINIASTRAFMSEANTEAYAASKGGIVSLTHALAISLGPQVRVNCISPGWIEVSDWKKKAERKTPEHSRRDRLQHPAGRVGVPEDVAAMVDFLISQEAKFITGANFIVDGGMTRKMIYED